VALLAGSLRQVGPAPDGEHVKPVLDRPAVPHEILPGDQGAVAVVRDPAPVREQESELALLRALLADAEAPGDRRATAVGSEDPLRPDPVAVLEDDPRNRVLLGPGP